MNLSRLAPVVLCAGLALAVAGCGDDEPAATASAEDPSTSAAPSAPEGGDAERYCELVAELEALGEQVFADVPQDAPPEEYMRREQQLLDQGSAQLEELVEVAPDAIADDVPVFLDDMRARASTGQSTDAEAASEAEERILAFEEENC